MATPTEAPPSYDSVIGKVDANVKANPSFEGLKKALANLNESEKAALASHDPGPLTLDPDQEKKFRQGFAQAFAQAGGHFEWNAEQCADLCKRVAEDFLAIAAKLSAVSSMDPSQASKDLVTDFVALEQRYQALLTSSRVSAVKVAQQADRFDCVVVPIAADKNISIDMKKKKIRAFIQEAEALEKEADGIQADFTKFLTEMKVFTARFDSWAQEKVGDLSQAILQLAGEIIDLKSEIAKIFTTMVGIAGVSGVALPALAVGACVAGPFAPLVIGIGLILAVGTVSSVTALAFKTSALNNELNGKETKKKSLEAELEVVQKSREELSALGRKLDCDVGQVVGIINTAWKYCQDDAVQIKKWLEGGENDLDVPPYMALQLGKADGIYSVIGKYLSKYADCLADTSKPPGK